MVKSHLRITKVPIVLFPLSLSGDKKLYILNKRVVANNRKNNDLKIIENRIFTYKLIRLIIDKFCEF